MWFLVASCHGRCGHDDAPWSAAFLDYLLGEVVCIILLQHPLQPQITSSEIHAAYAHVGVVHIIGMWAWSTSFTVTCKSCVTW